jgi:carbamoylphosphate synthase small subunit
LKKVHAIENATTEMTSPSKNHETPKISSTKKKHNYAVAREANIRKKKQKTSTVKNTVKQVTEKEDQNTQIEVPQLGLGVKLWTVYLNA